MLFEDALKLMREGKKIRHSSFEKDVYFQACYVTINPLFCPDGIEPFHIVKARGMSIVKMRGDKQHEDMGVGSFEHLPKDFPPCKHGYYPQLNLLLVMADDWEVYD